MTTQSLIAAHTAVLCSDDVMRRFFSDKGNASYTTDNVGYVQYRGEKVWGVVVGTNTFVCRDKAQLIPSTSGWRQSQNCGAISQCNKTKRCVGGCKK